MFSNSKFAKTNSFDLFVKKATRDDPEGQDSSGCLGFKNLYTQCKGALDEAVDSHTFVSEMKQTAPGVWECDLEIPLARDEPPKLKSIYKGTTTPPNPDHATAQPPNDASAPSSQQGFDDSASPPTLCGAFIPVYGPHGCNFPPDYRLVHSRLGPQYRCFYPANSPPHLPAYINNQFLRPTQLSRWDSNTPNDGAWDPFNLGMPPAPAWGVNPGFKFDGPKREVLVYPCPNYRVIRRR